MNKINYIVIFLFSALFLSAAEKTYSRFGMTDFEKTVTDGWRFLSGRQDEFISGKLCKSSPFAGKSCFKIEVKQTPQRYAVLTRTVAKPLKEAAPAAIKLAFRGDAPAMLIVRGWTPAKKWEVHSFTLPASAGWKEFQYVLNWRQSISQLAVELRVKSKGSFCFDNVRLLAEIKKNEAVLLLIPQEKMGNPEQISPAQAASCLPGPCLKAAIEKSGIKFCVAAYSPDMTADYLRRFNIIVLGTEGESGQKAFSRSGLDRLKKLLTDYVASGGGLFVTRSPGWTYGRDIERTNALLDAFGAKILNEQVSDDVHCFSNLEDVRFFWTGNIKKGHPVTGGVRGIFYPDYFNRHNLSAAGYSDFTSPVQTSADWKILISAMKTAKSMELKKAAVPPPPVPGVYKESAPLLAVREYGKGRIAVFPVAATIFWHDAEHVFWNRDATAAGSIQGRPGDSRRLMINLFNWLKLPSEKLFGGWNKTETVAVPDVGFRKVDWDQISFNGKLLSGNYIGLIGAQSHLSCGKSTPQQMIESARRAGYDFIAFTEELEKMSPEKFEYLKKLCAQFSNKSFQAYPGFSYRDESGNLWTVFSDKLFWPKKSWFSQKYPGRLIENNASTRAWGWPPVIWTENGKNPERSHLQGNFNTYAAVTYRHGKLTDDSRKDMERLLRSSYVFSPVVVHFVHSAQEIEQAKKSVWQTSVRWADHHIIDGVTGVGFGASLRGNPIYIRPSYITGGPVIEDFRILNFGISDLMIPGNDRWRMRVEASSSAGLKEVKIIDAERGIFRRFLPQGKKHFETQFDSWHAQQQIFLLEVTDVNGRKALSWRVPTLVQENNFLRCSDNFNTMPQGKWNGIPQHLQNIRGYENYLAKRGFQRSGTPRIANTGTNGSRPAVEYINGKSSRFGTVFDYRYTENYPNGKTANDDLTDRRECAVPNEFYNARVIYKMFSCNQNGAMIYRVDGEVDILKDFTTPEFKIFSLDGRRNAFNVTFTVPDGGVTRMKVSDKAISGKLSRYGAVGIWPSVFRGSIGFISLSDDLSFSVNKSGKNCFLNGFYKREKRQYRKGEKIRYSYVTVISQLDPPEDDQFLLSVRDAFGLNGKKALCRIEPAQGKVISGGFIFRLKAEAYSFCGKVYQEKLPLNQPVTVEGLNPRWDAGILYKGKNTLLLPIKRSNAYRQRYIVPEPRSLTDELYHIPVDEKGVSMLQIDTQLGDRNVFIGNLLTADDPELCLTLTDRRSGRIAFAVHNPTDRVITAVIRPGKGLDILGKFEKKVKVFPGTTLHVKIK